MKTPNLIEKAFLLKKTFLFQDINLDNLLAIADNLDSFDQEAGSTIFSINQFPRYMYVLVQGSVELVDHEGCPIATLGEGSVFGDEALFKEELYAYSANVKETASVLAITKKHFMAIIGECPTVAMRLLKDFSTRATPI